MRNNHQADYTNAVLYTETKWGSRGSTWTLSSTFNKRHTQINSQNTLSHSIICARTHSIPKIAPSTMKCRSSFCFFYILFSLLNDLCLCAFEFGHGNGNAGPIENTIRSKSHPNSCFTSLGGMGGEGMGPLRTMHVFEPFFVHGSRYVHAAGGALRTLSPGNGWPSSEESMGGLMTRTSPLLGKWHKTKS